MYRQRGTGFSMSRLCHDVGRRHAEGTIRRVLRRLVKEHMLVKETKGDEDIYYVPTGSYLARCAPDLIPKTPEKMNPKNEGLVDFLLNPDERGFFLGGERRDGEIRSKEEITDCAFDLASRLRARRRTTAYYHLAPEKDVPDLLRCISGACREALGARWGRFSDNFETSPPMRAVGLAPVVGQLLGIKPAPVFIIDGVESISDRSSLEALAAMVWSWTEVRFLLAGTHLPSWRTHIALSDCSLSQTDLVARCQLRDTLARAFHRHHIMRNRLEFRPWDGLSTSQRGPFYSETDAVPARLAKLNLFIDVSLEDGAPSPQFKTEQVEFLAVREHLRWVEEKRKAGYRAPEPGETANDDPSAGQLIHPALRPWEQLKPGEREAYRSSIQRIPEVLGEAGFCVGRIS
jgi:hypothetical protein